MLDSITGDLKALYPKMNKMAEGFKRKLSWDFQGDPVVKTSPSYAGGVGSSPGWGVETPHVSRSKNQIKTISTVTNSIKTLKMVHIEKKIFFVFKETFWDSL